MLILQAKITAKNAFIAIIVNDYTTQGFISEIII